MTDLCCFVGVVWCGVVWWQSDIGDADKSVLRNARKVEQFIISQLQTMLREKCVYPRMIPASFAKPNAAPPSTPVAAPPNSSPMDLKSKK